MIIVEGDYEKQISEAIFEFAKTQIPSTIKKKIIKKSVRRKMLDQYGDKAFLNPDKMKYPVVDPSTGEVHKGLVKAAYMRARQHGHTDIASKAKNMMQEHGEIEAIVQVEGHEESYDICQLMDLLELDFSSVNAEQQVKRVFRDPDGEIIVEPDDIIEWNKLDGTTCQGRIKTIDGNVAVVDVDGEEETVEL